MRIAPDRLACLPHFILTHIFWCHCILYIYLLTYLLTPWSRVRLEKLTGLQPVKKFPTYYGTRRFITALTSARHLSLSWSSSIQSIPPHPTSWRSILILSSHLHIGSPRWSHSLRFPHQNPVYHSPLPHTRYMPRPSHSSRFYHPNNNGEQYRSISSSLCRFLHPPVTLSLLGPKSAPHSQTPSACVPPSMSATKFHTHTKQQTELKFCTP